MNKLARGVTIALLTGAVAIGALPSAPSTSAPAISTASLRPDDRNPKDDSPTESQVDRGRHLSTTPARPYPAPRKGGDGKALCRPRATWCSHT